MIGLERLTNVQRCIEDVLARDVPGDLIEAGAWRGGAAIFMRGALEAFGDDHRAVWVADSFRGLPKPRPGLYQADAGDRHWELADLAVSLEVVQGNFARSGLLDDRVRFLPGWFHETLPQAPIERLAVMRIDGDMYESTIVALEALYPKLSPGGYVIVDDYYALAGCRTAVDDFRAGQHVDEELLRADWNAVYWQKR